MSDSAVPGSDKGRTFSHWETESCQDPWKDQVAGCENRLLAGCGVGEGGSPTLSPSCPSSSPPVSLRLRGCLEGPPDSVRSSDGAV